MNGIDARMCYDHWLEDVTYPGYRFEIHEDRNGVANLVANYLEPDINDPHSHPVQQWSRPWPLWNKMTKSQFVQTAFKCIMTSMEHRVREHFAYKGQLVFGPHFDIDALYRLCKYADEDNATPTITT